MDTVKSYKTDKLYIIMVGLPARGKTTIALKLKENLSKNSIKTKIFNNGSLRRRLYKLENTSYPDFFSPLNPKGVMARDKVARINMGYAKKYLDGDGMVAILDATHASGSRRKMLSENLNNHPVLFIECINFDRDILQANIISKITLPEFSNLDKETAIASFKKRIDHYESIYQPLSAEKNFIRINSLTNHIMREEINDTIPFYDLIRDYIVTDMVNNLYLIRHGETYFNLENRIGGDPSLTNSGNTQTNIIINHFKALKIQYIFTSTKKRTLETAEPIRISQGGNCVVIPIEEFDEIDAGICEGMSYEEIRETMPDIYRNRKANKYSYIYPGGEGYFSMQYRINAGIKKALYLSRNASHVMIIAHRATNRMILSHFLYRPKEHVPYIYIPQDYYYHITSNYKKKSIRLKPLS